MIDLVRVSIRWLLRVVLCLGVLVVGLLFCHMVGKLVLEWLLLVYRRCLGLVSARSDKRVDATGRRGNSMQRLPSTGGISL